MLVKPSDAIVTQLVHNDKLGLVIADIQLTLDISH